MSDFSPPMFTTIVFGRPEIMDPDADRIRKAYGLNGIVYDWKASTGLAKGSLHLMARIPADPDAERRKLESQCGYDLRLVSYEIAMEMVKIDESPTPVKVGPLLSRLLRRKG